MPNLLRLLTVLVVLASAALSNKAAMAQSSDRSVAWQYAQSVIAHLTEQSAPGVGETGNATIAFKIAPNGRLASASLARTSGSKRVDAAALALVQSAAPFPPPPKGVKASYTINIRSRRHGISVGGPHR